ncbi:MAG: hypothetical protein V1872_03250 [bacterium]
MLLLNLKKILNNYRFLTITLFIFIILSRVMFISSSADFGDSGEYIGRVSMHELLPALSTGHAPFHPGYIFISFYLKKLLKKITPNLQPALACTLTSVIFGIGSLSVFFLLINLLLSPQEALLGTFILSLIPNFWILNEVALTDSTYIFFFLLSIYLFYLWIQREYQSKKIKTNLLLLVFSTLSFGYSFFTHTVVILWGITFLGIIISQHLIHKIKGGRKILFDLIMKTLLFFSLSMLLFFFLYKKILNHAGYSLLYLFTGNLNDGKPTIGYRIFHLLIITKQLNSILFFICILGLISLLLKRNKQSVLLLLWILPGSILVANFKYSNLIGRVFIPAFFPLIICAVTLFFSDNKAGYSRYIKFFFLFVIIVNLIITSYVSVSKYKNISPNEVMRDTLNLSTDKKLYISHWDTHAWISGNCLYLAKDSQDSITSKVKESLDQDIPVHIGSEAIFFPFWIYDGHNFDMRGTSLDWGSFISLNNKEVIEYDPQEGRFGYGSWPIIRQLAQDYQLDLSRIVSIENKQHIYKLSNTDEKKEISLYNRVLAHSALLEKDIALIVGRVTFNNQPVRAVQIAVYSTNFSSRIAKNRINSYDLDLWLYMILTKKRDPLGWTFTDKTGFFVLPIDKKELEDIKIYTSPSSNKFKLEPYKLYLDNSGQVQFSRMML